MTNGVVDSTASAPSGASPEPDGWKPSIFYGSLRDSEGLRFESLRIVLNHLK